MDLTIGNVWKKMILFSIPLLFTLFLSQIFILSDSLIVSNTLGNEALAYIAPSQQATGIFQSIYYGLTVAASIIISNIYGAKRNSDLKKSAYTMFIFAFIICLIAAILAFSLAYPLLMAIQVPAEIFDISLRVYFIYVWTIVSSIISGMAISVIQALGDSIRPFLISLFSGLLNIGLDFWFILGFQGGVYGAAFATLFCQLLAGILSLILMIYTVRRLDNTKYSFEKRYIKEMLRLGIPSVIQQAVMSIGSLAIVSLIYSYGEEVISANVIAEQLNSLLFIPAVGITNAYATFAAQNYGAQMQKRINQGFLVMHILGLIVNTIVLIISFTMKDILIHMFDQNITDTIYTFVSYYLYFCVPYYFFIIFKYGFDSLFKAKGEIKLFVYSSIFNLGLRIALAYLFNYLFGLYWINLSMPISTLASGFFNLLLWKYSKSYRRASMLINPKESL